MAYVGIGNVAKKISGVYVGVGGVAKKVNKIYAGVNGVAKLVYSGVEPVRAATFSYTGTYTDQQDQTINGVSCRLLTLTASGTLTSNTALASQVWLCGGGASGGGAYKNSGGSGGRCTQGVYSIGTSGISAVVGAGATYSSAARDPGGASSFGTISVNANTSTSGGSGGGAGWSSAGTGAGTTTYPFGDTSHFQPHCAGGGGGSFCDEADYYYGGTGGSNGANGGAYSVGEANYEAPGGSYGGGKGGKVVGTTPYTGYSGTFYGAGGGGGGTSAAGSMTFAFGGAGYQGVIYIAIPYDQTQSVI